MKPIKNVTADRLDRLENAIRELCQQTPGLGFCGAPNLDEICREKWPDLTGGPSRQRIERTVNRPPETRAA
jgi:hypothetical protein